MAYFVASYGIIGSDAHIVEAIGADYAIAKSLLEDIGLQEVIYKQRRRQII